VPLLATHFLHACRVKYGRDRICGLTSRGLEALVAYSWPGNVRQLENWIENAVILAEKDLIDLEHFPELVSRPSGPSPDSLPPGLTLLELERRYIVETLRRMGGDRARTARALGISVRTLQYRLGGSGPRPPGPSRATARRRQDGSAIAP
jgi:DNA-binding NtrC family response regulator